MGHQKSIANAMLFPVTVVFSNLLLEGIVRLWEMLFFFAESKALSSCVRRICFVPSQKAIFV